MHQFEVRSQSRGGGGGRHLLAKYCLSVDSQTCWYFGLTWFVSSFEFRVGKMSPRKSPPPLKILATILLTSTFSNGCKIANKLLLTSCSIFSWGFLVGSSTQPRCNTGKYPVLVTGKHSGYPSIRGCREGGPRSTWQDGYIFLFLFIPFLYPGLCPNS